MEGKGLGWRPSVVDPRDFSLTPAIEAISAVQVAGKKSWTNKIRLDQQREGACCGFSFVGFINSAPKMHNFDSAYAFQLYHEITENDEFAGDWQSGQEGTSIRSSAKRVQARGFIKNYAFTSTIQEIVTWILNRSPVVMGIPWYSGQDHPTKDNGYRAEATGRLRGFHAIVVDRVVWGVEGEANRVGFANSWGTEYGQLGRAWFAERDLETLFAHPDSTACTAVEIR